ncbi:DUF3040 domain-containing protein [Pseudonocardia sp.]|jgi:hypothetical protein|uniref:DUF3040 domain-containing protein n=1 Tax=Pseudonocardia sp. TaxID=60912 RepID=UPI003D09DC0C
MLSREDRRRLDAIERQLIAQDPEFVRRVRRRAAAVRRAGRFPSVRTAGAPRLVWLGMLTGLVVLVIGIVAAAPELALTGVVFLTLSVWAGRLLMRHSRGHE